MSRRSGAVALTATITVTIFVAAMTFVLNPKDGSDDYASAVLEEAKNRQSVPVTVVNRPLETDIEVLRDEDIMAGKVSTILKEADGLFASSKVYADEKEKTAASYSETLVKEANSYTDTHSSALTEEIESLKSEISSLKSELESVKESSFTRDEAVSSLLRDEEFMSALSEEVSKRVGVEIDEEELASLILASSTFNKGLEEAMRDYYAALESEKKAASSIPIPVVDTATSKEYSEEEYLEERNSQRGDEINRILSFLGY